jgi:mannose-6-phosphate isomerase
MIAKATSQEGVSRVVEKPWGSETIFTESTVPYVGKLIHVRAGRRLSLQIHDAKIETMTVLSGRAVLVLEQADGTLQTISMRSGVGYTVPVGRKHRLCGITDSLVLEVSTPEAGTTFRLEDDYGRPDECRA